jgi:hypothetical protein
MTQVRQRSAANAVRKPDLDFGIIDNVVLTNVMIDDSIAASKKHIYLTFSQYDAETDSYIAESTFSWFKINPGSFTSNKKSMSEEMMGAARDLTSQLHNLLSCYLGEEAAFDALEDDFKPVEYETIDELLSAKWGKKNTSALEENMKSLLQKAITPFIGDKNYLLRIKVLPNKLGTHRNIPKYGMFVESMNASPSLLNFTTYEKNAISNIAMTEEEKEIVKVNKEQQL